MEGGVAVYMTQCCGRGATSPMSTRNLLFGGRVSKLRTAILAAAPARSLPRMLVCALILCKVVRWPSSLLACFKEVCDALEKKHVVMVDPHTADTRVGMLVLYGLETREGVGKYTDPFLLRECGESRVYDDEFRPHDSADLLRPTCVYVEGSGGGYVNHRRS